MKVSMLFCSLALLCSTCGCNSGIIPPDGIRDTAVGQCTNITTSSETSVSVDVEGKISTAASQTVNTENSNLIDSELSPPAQLVGFQIIEKCLNTSNRSVLNSDCVVQLQPRPDKVYDIKYLPISVEYNQGCHIDENYFVLYLHDEWGWYYPRQQVDLIPGQDNVAVGNIEILDQWSVGASQLIKLVAVPRGFSEEWPNQTKSLHPDMFTIALFELRKTR